MFLNCCTEVDYSDNASLPWIYNKVRCPGNLSAATRPGITGTCEEESAEQSAEQADITIELHSSDTQVAASSETQVTPPHFTPPPPPPSPPPPIPPPTSYIQDVTASSEEQQCRYSHTTIPKLKDIATTATKSDRHHKFVIRKSVSYPTTTEVSDIMLKSSDSIDQLEKVLGVTKCTSDNVSSIVESGENENALKLPKKRKSKSKKKTAFLRKMFSIKSKPSKDSVAKEQKQKQAKTSVNISKTS